jgi:hypothetical protein
MPSIDLSGFGHQEAVAVTGAKTLEITDQGVVQNVTASAVITLPSTVVGYSFTVRVGAPGLTVAVSPAALDLIAGNGFTAADDKDLLFTNQPAGSYVTIVGNGTTGWNVTAVSGTATREA